VRRIWWPLSFVVLSVVAVCAQRAQAPQGVGPCLAVSSTSSSFTCPNGASCGQFSTAQTDQCDIDNEGSCYEVISEPACCGKFVSRLRGDPCLITEMRDPRVRARILELAESYEILVPTCSGAYVPARIAFREHNEKGNGGL